MSNDDVLFRFRLRVMALARQLGSVRAACRLMDVHPSTFYRWRRQMELYGTDMLRPRERRQPRMPNAISVIVERQIIAFALGHPGFGPLRIAAELQRPKWGGLKLSANGVWRVLRRNGLNRRRQRLALLSGAIAAPEPVPAVPAPERHLDVNHPGQLIQMDCFFIGRLSTRKGIVWQYTAIDVVSAYTWAELHVTPSQPSKTWISALARRVASDLAAKGMRLEAVMTDNASEFSSREFEETLAQLAVKHVFIRPGRPQTNGCVERVQGTILQECWKPVFARHLVLLPTGLSQELNAYLGYYNHDRAHNGRWTRGRTPAIALKDHHQQAPVS
ncbi:MAG TPA: DDE-type integrase/transposase/recombinase [Candidatus Dormibacteraeota bacterium]|nr:DDE-type integrase/transposase/recombinase [Candidatus Dormibacteraeota bacterium]